MATELACPFTIVDVLPCKSLLLASPTKTLIVSIESGDLLASLSHASTSQAPRCCAVLPTSDSDKCGDCDCLIGLLGDDKELHVYKVYKLTSSSASLTLVEVWPLPKRGIKMAWEYNSGDSEATLVVGDRHGDVRSFSVSLAPVENQERESKRSRTDPSITNDEDGGELDETNPPHLGHAAMLTDLILTSFTSASPQTPASYIITSDRDEHIRISRWGKRRAGHIALRYLLGSTDAIGGLCIVEHENLEVLRRAVASEIGLERCKNPLLCSTDSSRLRIWTLYKDGDDTAPKDCLLTADLKKAISPFLMVNAQRERQREKIFGKGRAEAKKQALSDEQAAKLLEDLSQITDDDGPIVMNHLSVRHIGPEVYLFFAVDGATALFGVNLSKLLDTSVEEAVSHVQAMDLELPLLDHAFLETSEGLEVWMICDIRFPQRQGGGHNLQALRRATWNMQTGGWKELPSHSNPLTAKQTDFQSKGDTELVSSVLLYDALTLYPKQEFELASHAGDAIGPNGLIRGGIANFERTGQYKGSGDANHGNSERNSQRKVKAREEMLRRIEVALGSHDT